MGGLLVSAKKKKAGSYASDYYTHTRTHTPYDCFITEILFKLYLVFLTNCFSFVSAFSLPSLLFGTQGRSRRLKPFSTNKKLETWRGFCTWEGPSGSCWVSGPPFSLILTSILREQGWDKKGNKVLDREVNYKSHLRNSVLGGLGFRNSLRVNQMCLWKYEKRLGTQADLSTKRPQWSKKAHLDLKSSVY